MARRPLIAWVLAGGAAVIGFVLMIVSLHASASAPRVRSASIAPPVLASGSRIFLIPSDASSTAQSRAILMAVPQPDAVYVIAPDGVSASGTVALVSSVWTDGVRLSTSVIPPGSSAADDEAIGQALAAKLTQDPRAIAIGVDDVSQTLPREVAVFHDLLAQDVIASLSDEDAAKVESQSSGTLMVTLNAARELGLGSVDIVNHTDTDAASWFFVSFSPGAIQHPAVTTLLFTGDEMFDRNVEARITASGDPAYTYEKIQGAAKRFFAGVDEVIANLEGPITAKRIPTTKSIDFQFPPSTATLLKSEGITVVSQANNHSLDQSRDGEVQSKNFLTAAGVGVFGDETHEDASSSLLIVTSRGVRIALLGFNATEGPVDQAQVLADVSYAKAHADKVVVFMHWGIEYQAKPNATQIVLGHLLIDHGVDAVIGAHPHWVESIEVYKGHPIAYSLGNFVFDQDFSAQTEQGLVVGLAFTPHNIQLHLFPVSIVESQPALMIGAERAQALARLAGISDASLATQVKNGVIVIPN